MSDRSTVTVHGRSITVLPEQLGPVEALLADFFADRLVGTDVSFQVVH